MSKPQRLAEGTVLLGKLRIVRLLGEGGMGAVYEIEHQITQHRRALKLLHASAAAEPGVVERFLREASAAGRIGNVHIVETFDAGTLDTGEPYLVMEFLQGEPLSNLIARRGKLDPPELADIMGQVASGVQAAHDAGIVHRDLKPDNIFMTQRDGRPFPKIVDFGISKFAPQGGGAPDAMTREGSVLGTPYYMAPEQLISSRDVDARADVWAMGVILYEAAAGQKPFQAETLAHLAVLIHQATPTPLGELRPDLPHEFVELVQHAMMREREQRISTARELGERLVQLRGAPRSLPPGTQLIPSVQQPPATQGSVPAATSDAMGLAATMPHASAPQTVASGKGRGPVWAGVVALVLIAGVVVTLSLRTRFTQMDHEPPTPAAAFSTAAAPDAAPAMSAADVAPTASSATPVVQIPPLAAATGKAVAVQPVTRDAAAPATTGKGKRADTKGLATENPVQ